jgi:GH24 family phage-related lysozyme (muramidase)
MAIERMGTGMRTRREAIALALMASAAALAPKSARAQDSLSRFDALLANLQGDPELAAGAKAATDKPVLSAAVRRAGVKSRPSKLKISNRAAQLIVSAEVTSPKVYQKRYQGAIWPKGQSGVTVGIGYDIGHTVAEQFERDWKPFLDHELLDRLKIGCDATGDDAEFLLEALRDVRIPWEVAHRQFVQQQLPREIGLAERTLPNFAALPQDCRGAIVSLTYNRGTAGFQAAPLDEPEGRRKEMKAIYDLMAAKAYDGVPDQILSMRRLWEGKPSMAGVVLRREAEAALFQIGLDSLTDLNLQGIVIR